MGSDFEVPGKSETSERLESERGLYVTARNSKISRMGLPLASPFARVGSRSIREYTYRVPHTTMKLNGITCVARHFLCSDGFHRSGWPVSELRRIGVSLLYPPSPPIRHYHIPRIAALISRAMPLHEVPVSRNYFHEAVQ